MGCEGLKNKWTILEKQYTSVGSRILATVVLSLLGVICKRVKVECT